MDRARELWGVLRDFPWGHTLAVFRERLREDHLSLSASSLTFTTTIALVAQTEMKRVSQISR